MVISPFVRMSLLKIFMGRAACQAQLCVVMAARNSPARLLANATVLSVLQSAFQQLGCLHGGKQEMSALGTKLPDRTRSLSPK